MEQDMKLFKPKQQNEMEQTDKETVIETHNFGDMVIDLRVTKIKPKQEEK